MKDFDKSNLVGSLITIFIGLLLGFFGVYVSVFSDGLVYERAITILIVLIIYGVLSVIIGFVKSKKNWLYMLSLSLPGIILLLIYTAKDFNILYLLYTVLIFLVSYYGARSGKSLKIKKK